MANEEVTLTAQVRFRAPKAIYVVVKFDRDSPGQSMTALPFDGSPYDYDIDANECFLRYVLDETALPMTRLLEDDRGEPEPGAGHQKEEKQGGG